MNKFFLGVLIALLSLVVLNAAPTTPEPEQDLMRKVSSLYREGNFAAALELTDKAISEHGESLPLLQARFALLMKLDRIDDALSTALRREEINTRKRPWVCLDIADIYLRKSQDEKAVEWLEKAVERGFSGLSTFSDPSFAPLRDKPRFQTLIQRIRDQLGIDKSAKDFTVTSLQGGSLKLSEQKGKVVLIDFWATWCAPCRAEVPHLKTLYADFKAKGFEIIGISLDRDEQDLKKYIEENGLTWPIAFSGKAWKDETAALYGVQSIPSMWLIDRQGILRHFDLRGEDLREAVKDLTNRK